MAGLSALLLAVLAVATNIATALLPGWDWLRNQTFMWTAVGVLVVAVIATAVVGARLALPAPAAVVFSAAPRNPHFTGRAELLERLRRREFRAVTAIIVLRGLGGSGKSQTALEYAHLARDRRWYDVVWWVRAESESTLVADLARLAPALGVPEHDDRSRTIEEVHRALRDRRWLMIFDNAANPSMVRRWIVPGAGHTLVTTRDRRFTDIAPVIEIGTFTRRESLAYLRDRTGREERDAADPLARELGDLPLALAQAGAAISMSGLRVADYLGRFRARLGDAERLTADLADYPASVATTWLLQFEQLATAPRELLQYCAHLDVDDIDLTAVTGGLRPVPDAATVDDLVKSGLADRIAPDRLRTHRLVAEVTRHQLGMSARHTAGMVVRILHRLYPDHSWEPATWPACGALSAHVLAATGHPGGGIGDAAALLNRVALYLEYRGEYFLARPVSFRALGIAEQVHGADDPEVATAVLNLASLEHHLGRFGKGIDLIKKAMLTFEHCPDRRVPAGLLVMLGNLYEADGQFDEAVGTLSRALAMTEAAYLPGHPAVDDALLGLAAPQAPDLPTTALTTLRRIRTIGPPDHPDTALLFAAHGRIMHELGDNESAEMLLRRAAEINERVYGPEHPVTTGSWEVLNRFRRYGARV